MAVTTGVPPVGGAVRKLTDVVISPNFKETYPVLFSPPLITLPCLYAMVLPCIMDSTLCGDMGARSEQIVQSGNVPHTIQLNTHSRIEYNFEKRWIHNQRRQYGYS